MKKTNEIKQTKFQVKEDILMLIAYASLEHNGEDTGPENIQAEMRRIERVAESFYKDAEDREYNDFMISWLKDRADEIVYTNDLVYDIPLPDEPYDLNVDLFCRKAINV
jgi:hypothetical protein